jgi:GT2 family glycosyltransferase
MSIHVTVVVPTYNRCRSLERCIEALSASTLDPERFEVIVVDDGGIESVSNIIDSTDRRLNMNICLLRQSRSGPAVARNHGARHARGALLAFTDDDCRPQPTWLPAMLKAHGDNPKAMIGGRTQNGLPGNVFSEASQLLITYLYQSYRRPDGTPRLFTSNNLAIPTDAFTTVGCFDERFPKAAGEDREFCERWYRAGHAMHFEPGAVVDHHNALSHRRFLRQHFDYGRAASVFRRLCIEHANASPPVEPWGFYLNMLACPWRLTKHPRPAALSALLFLSQVMNTFGFFYENLPFVKSLLDAQATRGERAALKIRSKL